MIWSLITTKTTESTYTHAQFHTQRLFDQGKNKEIKDFLEYNENEDATYPNI